MYYILILCITIGYITLPYFLSIAIKLQAIPPIDTSQYIGCYIDDIASKDMKGRLIIASGSDKFNTTYCQKLCTDPAEKYAFFAIQNGKKCFCSLKYSTSNKYLRVNDDACGGKSANSLGAFLKNAVFLILFNLFYSI